MAISNKPPHAEESNNSLYNGVRKLVRPKLADRERRREPVHSEDPLSHAMLSEHHGVPESSHAEVFYFQKQMQQQTEMTIVLEDGEEIHGTIQWFDKCVVKVRSGRNRILIYKEAIKYLYKSSEGSASQTIMK